MWAGLEGSVVRWSDVRRNLLGEITAAFPDDASGSR